MKPKLRWLVARLGQDMNWWVDETSDEVNWGRESLSLLDPRQVAYLREELEQYREHGLRPDQIGRAFHPFEVASEMSDGRLRLEASAHDLGDEDVKLFALPDLFEEESDQYPAFLEQVAAARIRLLNATHHYFHNVDELDMEEELQARNADRYFSTQSIHVFNELEDILRWKPAEWDEAEEEAGTAADEDEDEKE